MKSFKKFASDLDEVSDHVKNRHIGMISASRETLSPEENVKRTKNLSKDMKEMGLEHIPVKGRYIKNYGTKEAFPIDEESFFVHSKDDLLPQMKKLGEKYNQDSILHKAKGSEVAQFHGTNDADFPGRNKSVDVGKFKPNVKGEFHSVLKSGKCFTFG